MSLGQGRPAQEPQHSGVGGQTRPAKAPQNSGVGGCRSSSQVLFLHRRLYIQLACSITKRLLWRLTSVANSPSGIIDATQKLDSSMVLRLEFSPRRTFSRNFVIHRCLIVGSVPFVAGSTPLGLPCVTVNPEALTLRAHVTDRHEKLSERKGRLISYRDKYNL